MLLRRKNLKNKKELSFEEILLDKSGKGKIEPPLSKNPIFYFFIFILISFSILFLRTFFLQVIDHQKYLIEARENYQRVYFSLPLRGIIYDRNFVPLVENIPSFDLILDKRDLSKDYFEREKVLKEISQLLKIDKKELEKKIFNENGPQILILKNISQEQLINFETKKQKFKGFFIQKNTKRKYLKGALFSHLLGYLGKITKKELKKLKDYTIFDEIGKEGLEKFYESHLRGKPGKTIIIEDARGNILERKKISEPKNGKSLLLWIDSQLQEKLKKALQKGIKRVEAKAGAAIILDPNTGGILALVSLPDFDNNYFSQRKAPQKILEILKDPQKPLFNRAISGQYPPGSTIKPLIALAALEEKIINPQKKILALGEIEVKSKYNPNIIWKFRDWKVHGWTDMRKAIANSVNIYFYTIGGGYQDQEGLGVKRIKKYLSFFGWGQKTGIDLPGENPGFLPDPQWKEKVLNEKWYIGNTYHLSIGQGYLRVTPLQVALATAFLANGGKLMKPQVVKAILNEKKEIIQEKKPEILGKNFIEKKNLKIVKEGMRDAVLEGSCKILRNLPVLVASKTGTAQTSRKGFYHHWVTIFAPYENPEIVLTILIENVKGLRSATLPVAKEFLDWYFSKK